MTGHAMVARLGSGDRVQVPVLDGFTRHDVDLVVGNRRLGYGMGSALSDSMDLGLFPSEAGVDILLLGAVVYAADTRISRALHSQDSWTREMQVVIPVSDPERWAAAEPGIRRLLNFLTGDRWSIGFRPRPPGFEQLAAARPLTLRTTPFDSVCLFSGGVDSLVGAIDLLEDGGTPLLVSHAGDGSTSNAQSDCFDALKREYEREFQRLRVWTSFPNDFVASGNDDNTRGRSFLFFSIAAFAGSGFVDETTIHVPENGLISLNVPLDVLRVGSMSTRTTHPFYMARWNDLLAAVGLPARVHNPYQYATKGEMISECSNRALVRDLAPATVSCASYTKGRWQGREPEHCGYCVPCIIRRAAFRTALRRDPTSYTLRDLTARPLKSTAAEGQQVRSFQLAARRVEADPALAQLLIHKAGPLTDELEHLAELQDVYRRGMLEVGRLLRRVTTIP